MFHVSCSFLSFLLLATAPSTCAAGTVCLGSMDVPGPHLIPIWSWSCIKVVMSCLVLIGKTYSWVTSSCLRQSDDSDTTESWDWTGPPPPTVFYRLTSGIPCRPIVYHIHISQPSGQQVWKTQPQQDKKQNSKWFSANFAEDGTALNQAPAPFPCIEQRWAPSMLVDGWPAMCLGL